MLHKVITYLLSILYIHENITNVTNKNEQNFSTAFPSLEDVTLLTQLSKDIYLINDTKACENFYQDIFLHCIYYEKLVNVGTQVMIVKSNDILVVVYTGSDEKQDFTNINLRTALVPFGPENNTINEDVKVHQGFNFGVFSNDLFHRILDVVQQELKVTHYMLYTTGHSLGAASALLTAVALSSHLPDEYILHVGVGEPVSGDKSWKNYVNSNDHLSVWRLVYQLDLIPRLPLRTAYHHVGHTVQLEEDEYVGCKAYYFHDGDFELGFAAVPFTWKNESYESNITGIEHHSISNYVEYLFNKSLVDPNLYYINSFEPLYEV